MNIIPRKISKVTLPEVKTPRRRLTKQEKFEYTYKLHEIVIYDGTMFVEYSGQECEVMSRSKNRNLQEYYKLKFLDGYIGETIACAIKRKEEVIVENKNK